MSPPSISEIREELRRLMEEQIDSLTVQAFGGPSQEEALRHDQRLKRIREVSADLLAALKHARKPSVGFRCGSGVALPVVVNKEAQVSLIGKEPS